MIHDTTGIVDTYGLFAVLYLHSSGAYIGSAAAAAVCGLLHSYFYYYCYLLLHHP